MYAVKLRTPRNRSVFKNHYKNTILSWFMPSCFTITSHTGSKTECLIYKLKTGYLVLVKILKYNYRASQA